MVLEEENLWEGGTGVSVMGSGSSTCHEVHDSHEGGFTGTETNHHSSGLGTLKAEGHSMTNRLAPITNER